MKRTSVLGQIAVSASLGVFAFLAIWTGLASLWLYAGALERLNRNADLQMHELSTALAPLVWNLDERSIRAFLDTKVESPEIVSVVVTESVSGNHWRSPTVDRAVVPATVVERRSPISFSGQVTGEVIVRFTQAPLLREVFGNIAALIVSQLLLFVSVLAALAFAWRRVAVRLSRMVQTLVAFTDRDMSQRMMIDRNDELAILARGFNDMANRIAASTHSMEDEIRSRTERLMESEKLALVGSLVAGVAHEINTPIGNGITMTSWLSVRTREVQARAAESKLSSAELAEFLADLDSGFRLLESGLDRTANLIQAFKKIGADQVVDERRSIAMKGFLDEIVVSLQPTLKRFPHAVTIDCREDLYIENHPGALFQIVTNLILNAHHHAFEPQQEGQIRVLCQLVEADLTCQIEVIDNGRGISDEVKGRIFEPFFTTKRLEGGTGLGLSIVHSLVQNLHGTVTVTTKVGAGTTFCVRIPRTAPDVGPA